jgi:hypothetical protein
VPNISRILASPRSYRVSSGCMAQLPPAQ